MCLFSLSSVIKSRTAHFFLMSMFSFLFLISNHWLCFWLQKHPTDTSEFIWRLKTRTDVSKTGFWSNNLTATTWHVCHLSELMPAWVSRVCSALYCSDCFIFPFPELFLRRAVKTEGSILGLIVNRVKQDIEVRPLNPQWASSEWHTWLAELNSGRGTESYTRLTQRAGAAELHSSEVLKAENVCLRNKKDKFTHRDIGRHLRGQTASQVPHGEAERHSKPEMIHRKLPLPQRASEVGCA